MHFIVEVYLFMIYDVWVILFSKQCEYLSRLFTPVLTICIVTIISYLSYTFFNKAR